jgi:hypothetical protein
LANFFLQLLKRRVGAEFFQVGILGEPFEIAVAQLDGLVERAEGAVKFIGERVAAREVVKHERIAWFEARETFVHVQSLGETAALGVMVAEQLQGVHIIWIAAHQPLDELDFHIEFTLFRAVQFFLGTVFGRHTTDRFFPTARGKSSGA